MEQLLKKIFQKIKKDHTIQAMEDLRNICRETMKTDVPLAVEYLVKLSEELEKTILDTRWSDEDVKTLYGLHKKVFGNS